MKPQSAWRVARVFAPSPVSRRRASLPRESKAASAPLVDSSRVLFIDGATTSESG